MESSLYPDSPKQVPADLTKPKGSFITHAILAMMGLSLFMLIYIGLLACFAWITYQGGMKIYLGNADFLQIIITASSALLTTFMIKSLFAVRKAGDPGGVEVTQESQPKLFKFLHQLADEVGAPRPHRVFITPEVNAAVFYDLSLLNLLFPSKKNLIIGLGLVNVLSLSELKAVLAHEFGHFAQGSMVVGRWVYIAQQIIAHMVATRDWLDSLVRFLSRVDLRVAWLGWILGLLLWSIRSLVDTLFGLVIMAERALSREMEFNADLVAVSVTGSDDLINALHKLQAADHAWQTALSVASNEAQKGNTLDDLFHAQEATISEMRRVLDNKSYGKSPEIPDNCELSSHRIFSEDMARPPQMWATHPPNRDREDNAKAFYIQGESNQQDAWALFLHPKALRQSISAKFYNIEEETETQAVSPLEAVIKRFDHAAYAPEYRGTYLNRSAVRNFETVDEMMEIGELAGTAKESLAQLYPESIVNDLDAARNLDIERDTLEALERGDLKPSGGVIRHRGEELKKGDIPTAIEAIAKERKEVADRLRAHDASCRRAHIQAANEIGNDWSTYLYGLIELLHCTEHMAAKVDDEHALLINTWQVITADKQIGFFEKRRMIRVCEQVQGVMSELTQCLLSMKLPQIVIDELGIENWEEQCPQFNLVEVNKKNWGDWCQAASNSLDQISNVLNMIRVITLEELINTEGKVRNALQDQVNLEAAPPTAMCPAEYPILMPGNENKLQRKLDLWNRFQLAHGFMPTLARLIVAAGIVGGTIFGGLTNI